MGPPTARRRLGYRSGSIGGTHEDRELGTGHGGGRTDTPGEPRFVRRGVRRRPGRVRRRRTDPVGRRLVEPRGGDGGPGPGPGRPPPPHPPPPPLLFFSPPP